MMLNTTTKIKVKCNGLKVYTAVIYFGRK